MFFFWFCFVLPTRAAAPECQRADATSPSTSSVLEPSGLKSRVKTDVKIEAFGDISSLLHCFHLYVPALMKCGDILNCNQCFIFKPVPPPPSTAGALISDGLLKARLIEVAGCEGKDKQNSLRPISGGSRSKVKYFQKCSLWGLKKGGADAPSLFFFFSTS